MRTSVEHRFPNGDPVYEYWLAHCEGFVLASPDGRHAGTVADVVLDAAAESVAALHVVRGRRGRPVVPAEAIAAVIPARRTLVLRHEAALRERRPDRSASARHLAARLDRHAAQLLVAAARATARAAAVVLAYARKAALPAVRAGTVRALSAAGAAGRGARETIGAGGASIAILVTRGFGREAHACGHARERPPAAANPRARSALGAAVEGRRRRRNGDARERSPFPSPVDSARPHRPRRGRRRSQSGHGRASKERRGFA